MHHRKHLTPENIAIAAKVMQAIDIEAETTFEEQFSEEVGKTIKASESDISELVDHFNKSTPPQILLMNSNGYRMLISLLANMLLTVNLSELAQVAMEAKEPES